MRAATTQFVLSLTIGILTAFTGWAALSPLSGEFQIVRNTLGHQDQPHLAFGPTGGFVAWQTASQQDKAQRVMLQRLGPDMTAMGSPIRLSQSSEANNELNPRVALLSGGGAIVVWEGGTRAAKNIHVRFVNSNGAFISPELIANTYRGGVQDDPDVAVLADGSVVVVWSSLGQDGSDEGVYGQVFTAAGARIGGEFGLTETVQGNQSDPAVVGLKGGGFAAAWMGEMVNGRNAAGANNLRGNIIGRLFDQYGRAATREFRLNEGDAIGGSPSLAGSPDGGFVLAWTMRDEENLRNLSDVYVRAFADNGTPLGDQKRHNTYLKGQQSSPQVVRLGSDALVVWTSYGQDGSGGSVQGRLLSGGSEFGINTQKNYHQKAPAVGTDGGNKFLAVWVNTLAPSHSVLSGQRYVTTDGDLDGVVDLTQGSVEVVEAAPAPRATPAPVARQQSAPPPAIAAEQSVVSIATQPAPTAPRPAMVAPAPVDSAAATPATPRPQAAPVTPASIPRPSQIQTRSLATLRGLRPSAASTRSVYAGRSALLAAAQRNLQHRNLLALGSPSLASRQSSYPARSSVARLAQRQSAPSSPGSSRQFTRYTRTSTRPAWNYGRQPTLASRQIGLRTSMSRSGQSSRDRMDAFRRGGQGGASKARTVAAALIRNEEESRLQWYGRRGVNYQVQGSDDLSSWNSVGAPRSGAGGSDSVNLNNPNGPRYYRVVRTN